MCRFGGRGRCQDGVRHLWPTARRVPRLRTRGCRLPDRSRPVRVATAAQSCRLCGHSLIMANRSLNPSRFWLGRSYKLALEPDGSPLFTANSLVACWRYEPREHLSPLALAWPEVLPSPLSDKVGYSDHVRFRGYIPVHFIPACNLPVYARSGHYWTHRKTRCAAAR